MKKPTKSETPADGISTSALRLARVALGMNQRNAALACGVGWRTMQRLELDEPVGEDIRAKIAAEWERRGITFLKTDKFGWGIRVARRNPEGPMGHEVYKAVRTALAMSAEAAAEMAGVSLRELNKVESNNYALDEIREKVRDAYAAAGVKFMFPGKGGWGFRIPESLSPERGRVILIRPRRKQAAPEQPTSEKAPATPKKGRGRPKKALTAPQTSASAPASGTSGTPKKKQGRTKTAKTPAKKSAVAAPAADNAPPDPAKSKSSRGHRVTSGTASAKSPAAATAEAKKTSRATPATRAKKPKASAKRKAKA